jgi:hypothetical protein
MAGCGLPSSNAAFALDVLRNPTPTLHMPTIRTTSLVALALTAAFVDTAAGQNVILSEFGQDANGSWIEVHNRGATPADISPWSIYLATPTPNAPRTYWWGFRPNTVIAPGGYLIVRWMQPIPSTPVAGEVATGNTVPYFLFGLGAEAVPETQGALALFRTQTSSLVSNAAVIADWVSWGGTGLSRENLAIQNGVWRTGATAPARAPGHSLARHPGTSWSTQPELAWFLDDTPTPGGANVGSASVVTVGGACAPFGHSLLGAPTLAATSMPVLGNTSFGVTIDNTTGVYAEWCILAMAANTMPFGRSDLLPPTAGADSCFVLVDPFTMFGTMWSRTGMMRTTMPMPLQGMPAGLAGQSFSLQAIVLDLSPNAWPPYKGLTNALDITIGN